MSKTVNVEVVARDKEDGERLIKRFMKKIKKCKLMDEVKAHQFFISDSEKNHEQDKRKKFLQAKKAEEEREVAKK